MEIKIANKKAAGTSTLEKATELDDYILKLREAITHEKTAESLHVEAQQVQDHMTYLITYCGIDVTAANLHPNILQLIQNGQHLLSKAQEEVI